MFETIRKIKELSKSLHAPQVPETDADGRCIVNIHVSDDSGFLSPFSSGGTPVINGDTAEFLNHSLKHLKPENRVHFVITSDQIDADEQVIYKGAIENYYRQELYEKATEIRKNTVLSALMTLVAAIIFTADIIFGANNVSAVFLDMLDVVAWVFMWEAVDLFCLQRSQLRRQQLRCLQIMTAEISYKQK